MESDTPGPGARARNQTRPAEIHTQDPQEELIRLLEELRQNLACDAAWISLFDEDPMLQQARVLVAAGDSLRPDDPAADPESLIASSAVYPLEVHGKTVAHLHLASRQPDALDPASLQSAAASLGMLAVLVQHALLLGWHQRQSRYLGMARELIKDLGACGRLRECAEHFTRRMAEFLELDRAILHVANAEGTWFTCEAAHDRAEGHVDGKGLLPGFRIDDTACLRPLLSGQIVEGMRGGPGHTPCAPLCEKLRLLEGETAEAVPLVQGSKLVGILFAVRRGFCPIFAAEEREPICLLARQIAPILHSHQVVERHERGAHNFAELLDMSHAVSSTSDLTKIPDVIAHRARALCEADEATIFLLEPDGQTLKPVVCLSEWAEQMLKARIRIGEGLTGTVAASRRAEVISHAEMDPRTIQIPGTPLEPEALLAAPLICADRLLGVLTLHKLEGRLFRPMDLETIEIFASQAAIALENARLIARVREERSRLVTMLRQMEEGVVFVDKDGRVLLVNDAAGRMLGPTEREYIGVSAIDLLDRPDFTVVRAALERMRHEEERNVTQEYAVRGRTYLCSITAVRTDETVQGEGEVILFKDITELKEIENQLLQSSKMSAVGQLAAGVAHEFNNLMASVYGYAQFMKQHPENTAVVQKGVDVILRSSERARDLTTSLLTFSRRRPGRREPVDVNQILTDTLLLLHRQMEKSGVRVEREVGRVPLTVADPGKVQEVFLNLLVNAQQAMADGGHLRVTSRVEGANIEVRVEDDGPGIPPEHLGRIFEPFFTTKGSLSGVKQPGTGLGLSTAYNHMREHGGSIRVASAPGEGACFVVQLPIRTIHEKREEVLGPAPPRSLDVSGRVLIVEEDPTLSGLMAEILGGLGHEVEVASEGSRMLPQVETSPPDLLILNAAILAAADAELLPTLRARAPQLPILLVTNREATQVVESGGDPWLFRLNKPFRNRDLVALVSRILAQSLRRAG